MKFKVIHRHWFNGKVYSEYEYYDDYKIAHREYRKWKNLPHEVHYEVRLINLQTKKTTFEYRSW
jgi:hypothetical protein